MKKGARRTKHGKKSSAKGRARSSKAGSAKRAGTKRRQLALPPAGEADRKEAEHFVESLKANKQLSEGPGPLPPGATHKLETDKSGAVRVVRKRYSAI
jgi:hypothetical protein